MMQHVGRADARGDRRRRAARACSCSTRSTCSTTTRARSCACATPTRCSSAARAARACEELGERIEHELRTRCGRSSCSCPTPTAAASPSCTSWQARSPRGHRPRACACARSCRRAWLERFERFAVAASRRRAQRSSPLPESTPRRWRESSFSRFPRATSSRSSSSSLASCATYQSTSPSSLDIAARRSSLTSPPSSRIAFLACSATSPASPARPSAG